MWLPQVVIQWVEAPEIAPAYVIDLSIHGLSGPFVRLTPTPITGTTFVDQTPPSGPKTYRVHTGVRTTSGSGTYDNLSQGILVAVNGF